VFVFVCVPSYSLSYMVLDNVQMYTWMDASLRELTDLVKEVQPAARRQGARLEFALVYPDRKGRNVMRQVGIVYAARETDDDFKTLKELNFQVMQCSICRWTYPIGSHRAKAGKRRKLFGGRDARQVPGMETCIDFICSTHL
jgi:hypothetical protein